MSWHFVDFGFRTADCGFGYEMWDVRYGISDCGFKKFKIIYLLSSVVCLLTSKRRLVVSPRPRVLPLRQWLFATAASCLLLAGWVVL